MKDLFIGACSKCESPVFLDDCSGRDICGTNKNYICPENSTLIYKSCNCDANLIRRTYAYHYWVLPTLLRFSICGIIYFFLPELVAIAGYCMLILTVNIEQSFIRSLEGKEIEIYDEVEIEGGKTLFMGVIG